jgi:hypothetical protein
MLAVCSTHEHEEVLTDQQGVVTDSMESHKIRPNEWSLGYSVHKSVLMIIMIIIMTIIIIIIFISFMQGIYIYIPETDHVLSEYIVAAILSLLCMVYLQYLRWLYCTFTLALSEVCVQCQIWLFSVVP